MQQQLPARRGNVVYPDAQPLNTPGYIEKDQHTVVQGTTQPMMGPAVRGLFGFGFLFILAFTALAAYYGYKISTDAALVLALMTFGVLSFVVWRLTVVVASGNYAARMEIRQRNKLELRKLEQGERVTARQLAMEQRRQQYIFELERAKMEKDEEMQRLRLELATAKHDARVARNAARGAVMVGEHGRTIDGELADASAGSATDPTTTRKGYITAGASPVRIALMDYLFGSEEQDGIYGWDGQLNPDLVDLTTGKLINHTIPWSTRGALKASDARREAQRLLQPAEHEPLVYYNETDKSWYVNLDYCDAETAQIAIGGY